MSKLTDFLRLFKYDPSTDKLKTFNIDTALNENWDKVDTELKKQAKEIDEAIKPYVIIPKGSDILLSERKTGKLYFKVTDKQATGGGNSSDSIRVSPAMGIKISEV